MSRDEIRTEMLKLQLSRLPTHERLKLIAESHPTQAVRDEANHKLTALAQIAAQMERMR